MDSLRPELLRAVEAAQNKKAAGITLLDFTGLSTFTDYFLVCTGFSSPQVKAICDEIEEQLALMDIRPAHREGYASAEWVLLDFRSFIVHIFSERARSFYDLERLWRSARRVEIRERPPDSLPDASSGIYSP
jgi:ribosome-associated protein